MSRNKKQYWVAGADSRYIILGHKPEDTYEWPCLEGPFATLAAAKKQARYWISSDRRELENALHQVNATKASDFISE